MAATRCWHCWTCLQWKLFLHFSFWPYTHWVLPTTCESGVKLGCVQLEEAAANIPALLRSKHYNISYKFRLPPQTIQSLQEVKIDVVTKILLLSEMKSHPKCISKRCVRPLQLYWQEKSWIFVPSVCCSGREGALQDYFKCFYLSSRVWLLIYKPSFIF